MSPARKTTSTPEPDVELPVAAEPTLPPGVTPPTTVDASAAMADCVRLAGEIQPHALVVYEAHEDESVRALAGQVYGLATCVAAIAKANA